MRPQGRNATPKARKSSAIAPQCRFIRLHRNCASGGILFSVLPEKSMQKRGAGERNSAYAQKNESLDFTCYHSSFRSPNALRATVESGFRIARYAVQIALLAPVEYLTYGSRKRRRVFRLPRRSVQIRICIAFLADLKYALHKPNPWE